MAGAVQNQKCSQMVWEQKNSYCIWISLILVFQCPIVCKLVQRERQVNSVQNRLKKKYIH
jgi:hypothetical protein